MSEIKIGDEGRRRELYEMLEHIGTDVYVDQERLVELVGLYPPKKHGQSFSNSTAHRMITKDIQAINSDPQYERIILSSAGTKGIKLATKSEAMAYITKRQNECFRKLKRLAVLSDKVMKHGQVDMDGNIRCEGVRVLDDGTVSIKYKANKEAGACCTE